MKWIKGEFPIILQNSSEKNILNYLEMDQRRIRSKLRPSDEIFDEKHKNNGRNLPSPQKS